MDSHCLNYRDTGAFSAAAISYLDGDERLVPFYSFPPTLAGFGKLIEAKKPVANRAILADVLTAQYDGLPPISRVTDNIAGLRDTHTFTITTGHQLNIFTGPLYFIYKIVTAINLAKQLAEEFPGKKFVPVYWMASEDHDFAEINHLTVAGENLAWNTPASGATGKIDPATLHDVLTQYLTLLGPGDHAPELATLIRDAYTLEKTLAGATRRMVHALFGRYGLIVVDADDHRLKQLFAPYMERDLLEQNSYREISQSSQSLKEAGFATQVNAREVNFFYLAEGLRERITREGDTYYVLNSPIRFTTEELKIEIRQHPENFSPNVMLRPLYQEVILPNLAYIGGGAELVYWLQLKGLFDFYKVDYPVLLLRNSAMIVGRKLADALNNTGFTYLDLFKDPELISKEFALKKTGHRLSTSREQEEISTIFDQLKQRLTAIDTTLVPSAAAIRARLNHALGNLDKKMIKAEKRNFSKEINRLLALREKGFPNGSLQERVENFGPFYARYGSKFIDGLIEHFRPLDFMFTILVED